MKVIDKFIKMFCWQ